MTSETKGRIASLPGQTQTSADSNTPPSSQPGRVIGSVGRNDIEAEMAMLMKQRMQQEGRFGHVPSMASSVNSSLWSSSQGDSEGSETYAWSASLNSGSSDDSDSSSYSSDYESSSVEEGEDDVVPPLGRNPHTLRPGAKKYPQPPAHMMGGLLSNNRNYPQPPDHMMKRAGTDKTIRQPLATTGGNPGEKVYPQPPPEMLEGLPFGMEGFNLESLRRDLEKVGRAILSSNAGELAAERAQTLASINWLASHLPNAVLDQLGHETRKMVGKEATDGVDDEQMSQGSFVASMVESDAMSEVSELSQEQLNLDEFGFEVANTTQSNGSERAKDKTADQIEEDLPGGIPFLLSPRRSPSKKKKKSIKALSIQAVGAFDFGTTESCIDEIADNNSISISHSSDVNVDEEQIHGSKQKENQTRGKRLPFSSDYRCALLFVDISGFTRLSTKLDPEALSKVRNSRYAATRSSRMT